MNYLITGNFQPFFTNWFDKENHYRDGMIVYDLINFKYTEDGDNWIAIPVDHL